MLIYLCLSSHGYGHAARQAAIFNELYKLNPKLKLVVSSIVNYQYLTNIFSGIPIIHRRIKWDVGTVQKHALETDYKSTLYELDVFQENISHVITNEISWIKNFSLPVLVLADIPPAAAELAEKLDAPLILMSNFGWDDIYEKFPAPFEKYVYKFRKDYSKANHLLRFPFSLKMDWKISENSVGLTFSSPRKLPDYFRRKIDLINKPLSLVCFGGLGLQFDYNLYNLWPDSIFICLGTNSLEREKKQKWPSNTIFIPKSFRIVDLLPYTSRIICKPGFSTFCEAISTKVGIHSVNRHGFAESSPLINGLQEYSFHRLLNKESFMKGDWELDKPLLAPVNENLINKDGATSSAKRIIEFINLYFN